MSPREATSNGAQSAAQNGMSPREATSNGAQSAALPDSESLAALAKWAARLYPLDHTTHGVDVMDFSGPAPEW
jgi:hypothetical protein